MSIGEIRDIQYFYTVPALDELSRIVARLFGDRIRQAPARIFRTIHHVYQRVARLRSLETSPDDRSHVRMIDPGLDDERSDRMYHNHRVVVLCRHRLDQLIAIEPRCQILPVK